MTKSTYEKFNLKSVLKLVVFFIVVFVAILLANALIQIAINVYYVISIGNGQQAKDAATALINYIWVQTFTSLAQNVVLVLIALAYLRIGNEPVTLERLGLKYPWRFPKAFHRWNGNRVNLVSAGSRDIAYYRGSHISGIRCYEVRPHKRRSFTSFDADCHISCRRRRGSAL